MLVAIIKRYLERCIFLLFSFPSNFLDCDAFKICVKENNVFDRQRSMVTKRERGNQDEEKATNRKVTLLPLEQNFPGKIRDGCQGNRRKKVLMVADRPIKKNTLAGQP